MNVKYTDSFTNVYYRHDEIKSWFSNFLIIFSTKFLIVCVVSSLPLSVMALKWQIADWGYSESSGDEEVTMLILGSEGGQKPNKISGTGRNCQ